MADIIFLLEKNISEVSAVVKEQLFGFCRQGGSLAVKLHMGEKGAKYYLKPELVVQIVEAIKGLGFKPFLFDSPVVYAGSRDTEKKYNQLAVEHGFTEESIGCPIVISNDFVEVDGRHLTYRVCKTLIESDGVLVLSHVKGHICSGMGGAVKNLGMGALSKESKGIIHEGGSPKIVGKCVGCASCVETCPISILRLENNKVVLDDENCIGCSQCIESCNYDVLKPKVAMFDILLADGASAAFSQLKKTFFINVVRDIADKCDCDPEQDKILVENIGILFGQDPVAVDKASLDLINEKAKKNIFLDINNKEPELHLDAAAKFGIGSMEYSLRWN